MNDGSHIETAGSPTAVYETAVAAAEVRKEIWAWAALAVASLAISGLFALFVAVSRVPGIDRWALLPSNFFFKGLVIHIVFSFVVWFLAVFALFVSLACFRVRPAGQTRVPWMGWLGLAVCWSSFPLLFLSPFFGDTEAFLSSYVPAIGHPLYDVGLALFFAGILLPVVRLFANIPGGRSGRLDPLSFAAMLGGGIYIVVLVCMAVALKQNLESQDFSYQELFWGGGHVLQFLNTLLMLAGWYVLARIGLGTDVFDTDLFRLATTLLMVFVLPPLFFYAKLDAFSARQTEAFTALQYALALPVVLMGGSGLAGLFQYRRAVDFFPWKDPAFLCLVLSLSVFGVGGFLGFMVDGTDARTPGHYHGVIAGVTLAFMGLFLTYFLPILGRAPNSGPALRLQITLFGLGQMLACVGLFLAGGHGAPRRAPDQMQSLVDGAVVGMYLNGIGAVIAVIGGAMFVWTACSALLRAPRIAAIAHAGAISR